MYANSFDGVFYVDKWVCGYKGTMPTNTTISLIESTTGIADRAFSNCTELTNINIPASVTTIGSYAFWGCSTLTCVTIPNSVMRIEDDAFANCSGLTNVTIPSSVTSIGKSIFYGCSSLTNINVSVTNLFAFCNNTLLRALNGSKTVIYYRLNDRDGNEIKKLIIPENVKGIGDNAFNNCSGLTSVTIGSGVTSIGNKAFDGVDIPTVVSLIENPFTITGKTSSTRTFTQNTFNNATLYVPKGTIDKYKATNGWKDLVSQGRDEVSENGTTFN